MILTSVLVVVWVAVFSVARTCPRSVIGRTDPDTLLSDGIIRATFSAGPRRITVSAVKTAVFAAVNLDEDAVGHVVGLAITPGPRITHLIIDRGRLWRHREITVPIGSVERLATDKGRFQARRDALGTFPSARFDRHGAHRTGTT